MRMRILGSLVWSDLYSLLASQTSELEDYWPLASEHPLAVEAWRLVWPGNTLLWVEIRVNGQKEAGEVTRDASFASYTTNSYSPATSQVIPGDFSGFLLAVDPDIEITPYKASENSHLAVEAWRLVWPGNTLLWVEIRLCILCLIYHQFLQSRNLTGHPW
jgi:hypothetical protein